MPSQGKAKVKTNAKSPGPPAQEVRATKTTKPTKTWAEVAQEVLRRDAALWERLAKL